MSIELPKCEPADQCPCWGQVECVVVTLRPVQVRLTCRAHAQPQTGDHVYRYTGHLVGENITAEVRGAQ